MKRIIELLKRLNVKKSLSQKQIKKLLVSSAYLQSKNQKDISADFHTKCQFKSLEWYSIIGIERVIPILKGIALEIKGSPRWKIKAGRSKKDKLMIGGTRGNKESEYKLGLRSTRGRYSLKLKYLQEFQ